MKRLWRRLQKFWITRSDHEPGRSLPTKVEAASCRFIEAGSADWKRQDAASTFRLLRSTALAAGSGLVILLFIAIALRQLTPAQAQTQSAPSTAALIPTRLTVSTNGAVAVSFKGIAGQNYQIYYADAAAETPVTTDWKLAAANLVADPEVWTAWVDEGGFGRLHPRLGCHAVRLYEDQRSVRW